jgi:hypothetical protein
MMAQLRLNWTAVAWGSPSIQSWMVSRITDSDQAGYTTVDVNGRVFRLWRMA